jgi:hypothetical protein
LSSLRVELERRIRFESQDAVVLDRDGPVRFEDAARERVLFGCPDQQEVGHVAVVHRVG